MARRRDRRLCPLGAVRTDLPGRHGTRAILRELRALHRSQQEAGERVPRIGPERKGGGVGEVIDAGGAVLLQVVIARADDLEAGFERVPPHGLRQAVRNGHLFGNTLRVPARVGRKSHVIELGEGVGRGVRDAELLRPAGAVTEWIEVVRIAREGHSELIDRRGTDRTYVRGGNRSLCR